VTGLRGCSDGRTTRSRSVRDLAVPTCPYPFGFPFPNASSGNGPFTNAAYQIGASWTAYLYRHRHHDRALGFIHGTSHGLQPWTRYELTNGGESLTVESLPAVHAYGVLGKLLPPVMGSLLVHRVAGAVRRRVYISGDTLTGEHLDEIRERHPEIDTAVVHLGGTRLLFWTVTMDANQGVDFLQRIRPHLAVPVHYNDYRVFRSRCRNSFRDET
jgi:hypothetical protein